MSKDKVKKNDRTTIPGFLYDLTPTMIKELDTFMYDYGFMFRHAFKQYIEFEGKIKDTEEIQKEVQKLEKDLSQWGKTFLK